MNTSRKVLLTVMLCAVFSGASAQLTALIPYRLKDKWGYADTGARICIQPQFDSVGFFSSETRPLAVIKKRVNGWPYVGMINPKGQPVIPPVYDSLKKMGEVYLLYRKGVQGWLANGERPFTMKPVYRKILGYNDDVLLVQTREGKYGACYIKNGELVDGRLFERVSDTTIHFENRLNDHYRVWFYNERGEEFSFWEGDKPGLYHYEQYQPVTETPAVSEEKQQEEDKIYNSVMPPETDRLAYARVIVKNAKYGLFKFGSEELLPAVYDKIELSRKFAVLLRNNQWEIVDHRLQRISKDVYDSVKYFTIKYTAYDDRNWVDREKTAEGFWVKKKKYWQYLHLDGTIEQLRFDGVETVDYPGFTDKAEQLVKCRQGRKLRLAKTDYSKISPEYNEITTLGTPQPWRPGQFVYYMMAKTDSCLYLSEHALNLFDNLRGCQKLFADNLFVLEPGSRAFVAKKNNRYGIFQPGTTLLQCVYDTIYSELKTTITDEKFFVIGDGSGKKGVMRYSGDYTAKDPVFIPFAFDAVTTEYQQPRNYLKLRKGDSVYYCTIDFRNRTKETLFFTHYFQPNRYCTLSDDDQCRVTFVKNGKWGVLDYYGNLSVGFVYDSVAMVNYADHPFVSQPYTRFSAAEIARRTKFPLYYTGRKGDSITLFNYKAKPLYTQKCELLVPLNRLTQQNTCLFKQSGLFGICDGQKVIVPASYKKIAVEQDAHSYDNYNILIWNERETTVSLGLLTGLQFRLLPGKYRMADLSSTLVQTKPMTANSHINTHYRYFRVVSASGQPGYIDEFGREFFKD